MDFQFNPAQLSRPQRNSLIDVLGVIQDESALELVVTPVEFPNKLKVKLDDGTEMLLGWDVEKEAYAGLTTPEPIPESQKDTVDLPTPEPTPELFKSEVGQRVYALARALAKLSKPLDIEQRCEVWVQFTGIFIKELMG